MSSSVHLVLGLSRSNREAVTTALERSPEARPPLVVEIRVETPARDQVGGRADRGRDFEGNGPEVVVSLRDGGRTIGAHRLAVDDCCVGCTLVSGLPRILREWSRRDEGTRGRDLLVSLPSGQEGTTLVPTLVGAFASDGLLEVGDVVVAVDAILVAHHLDTDDLLADLGLESGPADRRAVAEVLARQVEGASRVVLVGLDRLDRLDPARSDVAVGLVRRLNPLAEVLTCQDGVLRPSSVPGDRVSTIVWCSHRPLHPRRLAEVVEPLVRPVARSVGVLRLAGHPAPVRWESAGGVAAMGLLDEPDAAYGGSAGPDDQLARRDGRDGRDGPATDQVSELAMIGVDLDVDAVTTLLAGVALTDAELAMGPQVWSTWTSRLDGALER